MQCASVVLNDGILKAEYCLLSDIYPSGISDDEVLRLQALQYAYVNGLMAAEANVKHFDGCTLLTLRSSKILDENNNEIPVTFVNKMYFGKSSVMILYTGTKASLYPTVSISKFVDSFQIELCASSCIDPEWILYQNTPTGAKRYIDIANICVSGSIIQYRQKFVTSSGIIKISAGQMDCSNSKSRLVAWDITINDYCIFQNVSIPFELAWNDYTEMFKHDCFCLNNRVQEVINVKNNILTLRREMLNAEPYVR